MAKRDSFLLRVDPKILAGLRRWADDEMRSINGQIEFLLRKMLREAGRLESQSHSDSSSDGGSDATED
jgi:hypothetical protein